MDNKRTLHAYQAWLEKLIWAMEAQLAEANIQSHHSRAWEIRAVALETKLEAYNDCLTNLIKQKSVQEQLEEIKEDEAPMGAYELVEVLADPENGTEPFTTMMYRKRK